MAPRNPRQVKIVSFGLWEIFRLRWEMAQRDIHATALALIDRRRRVQARVVLAGGQSLLHAGRVVQPLGLAVAVPRPLASVHAVLPAARHRVAPHPGMRHLVHVGHAVVHHGEPQRSTMKEVKSGKKKTPKKLQECQSKTADCPKKIKGKMEEKSSHVKERLSSSGPQRGQPLRRSFIHPRAEFLQDKVPHPPPPGQIGGQSFMTTQSSNLTLQILMHSVEM